MGGSSSPWIPGVSPDRRQGGDRRVPVSILCQEALAEIVVETRGEDSYAGRALHELRARRAAGEGGNGEQELIVYSLRGRWIVGTVAQVRAELEAAASAACRRGKPVGESLPSLLAQELGAELPPPSQTPQ
ncbi:hypothetical protein [Aquabacterium sp.]|uniref:hypothetical protein n=1 Tax=Aquabacterium sp. TaxID=1872578 RepID=UPI00378416A4